jgi:hypothetical protein
MLPPGKLFTSAKGSLSFEGSATRVLKLSGPPTGGGAVALMVFSAVMMMSLTFPGDTGTNLLMGAEKALPHSDTAAASANSRGKTCMIMRVYDISVLMIEGVCKRKGIM